MVMSVTRLSAPPESASAQCCAVQHGQSSQSALNHIRVLHVDPTSFTASPETVHPTIWRMLARNSREIERPRQIDVHSKVPHVQRVRLSIGTYDLFGRSVLVSTRKRSLELGTLPTLAAAPTPAQLMTPPNGAPFCFVQEMTSSTTLVMSSTLVMSNSQNLALLGASSIVVASGGFMYKIGDISLLLKDVSDCRKSQARRA